MSSLTTLFFPDGLQPAGNLSRPEIKQGFRLFFLNHPQEARQFFTTYEDVPFCSMGLSAVLFLWALLTLEDKVVVGGGGIINRNFQYFQLQPLLSRTLLRL